MNKESLEILKEKILEIEHDKRISTWDRMELIINMTLILDHYEENIKILNRYGKKRKK